MTLQNNNSYEIAKKFYEQLDSSQIESLTKERWEEINQFANAFITLNLANDYNHYYSLEESFSIIVQKVLSSKNNILLLARQNTTQYNSDTSAVSIELRNDAEKILFIQIALDPKNHIINRWSTIKNRFINPIDNLFSPSNYLKAMKIMKSYYGGFFILKLFNNAELLQKHFNKISIINAKSK